MLDSNRKGKYYLLLVQVSNNFICEWVRCVTRFILATQAALSVSRIYFFLVQSFLKVDTARIIAISSLRLMSMMAGLRSQLHREAKKYSSNVAPAPIFEASV